jgi:hypothetical protein
MMMKIFILYVPIHIHICMFQISEGDGFSDRVCTSCIENLSTAYLFKQQCERIDTLLRKCPGNSEHIYVVAFVIEYE